MIQQHDTMDASQLRIARGRLPRTPRAPPHKDHCPRAALTRKPTFSTSTAGAPLPGDEQRGAAQNFPGGAGAAAGSQSLAEPPPALPGPYGAAAPVLATVVPALQQAASGGAPWGHLPAGPRSAPMTGCRYAGGGKTAACGPGARRTHTGLTAPASGHGQGCKTWRTTPSSRSTPRTSPTQDNANATAMAPLPAPAAKQRAPETWCLDDASQLWHMATPTEACPQYHAQLPQGSSAAARRFGLAPPAATGSARGGAGIPRATQGPRGTLKEARASGQGSSDRSCASGNKIMREVATHHRMLCERRPG